MTCLLEIVLQLKDGKTVTFFFLKKVGLKYFSSFKDVLRQNESC